MKEREDKIQILEQQLQQDNTNNEAQKQLERLQQDFQQMWIGYQKSFDEKGKQLQDLHEIHKDNPKLTKFIPEYISLNEQLLQQQEVLSQKISQWSYYCEISDKITNQLVDFRSDYDLIDKRVTEYLAWQNEDEGKRAGALKINENHKELLFNKWDDQIREAEQAAETEATAVSSLIDCINENLHKENLIAETTPGYLPKKLQLEAEWKQRAQEKAETIQGLNRLNWKCYWAYLVKPHSEWMTIKCIINAAEKIALALIDSVFLAQL